MEGSIVEPVEGSDATVVFVDKLWVLACSMRLG